MKTDPGRPTEFPDVWLSQHRVTRSSWERPRSDPAPSSLCTMSLEAPICGVTPREMGWDGLFPGIVKAFGKRPVLFPVMHAAIWILASEQRNARCRKWGAGHAWTAAALPAEPPVP